MHPLPHMRTPPKPPAGMPSFRAGRQGQPPPKKPMSRMADGGFGIPAPIGGAAGGAPEPPPPEGGAEPEGDEMGAGAGTPAVVRPEAVNFHDDAQNCGSCTHFGQDGQCVILQMQVPDVGGCTAFEGASSDNDQDDQPGGEQTAGAGDASPLA